MAKGDEKIAAEHDHQGLDELRYIQQVYQNQYTIAGNSINIVLQELQELNSAQKTLENTDIIKGKDTLNSIGAQFYMFGKVQDPNKVIVAVGANYLVEKDTDSAKEYVASLIQKRTESLNAITKSRKEIEKALIEISYKIESLH